MKGGHLWGMGALRLLQFTSWEFLGNSTRMAGLSWAGQTPWVKELEIGCEETERAGIHRSAYPMIELLRAEAPQICTNVPWVYRWEPIYLLWRKNWGWEKTQPKGSARKCVVLTYVELEQCPLSSDRQKPHPFQGSGRDILPQQWEKPWMETARSCLESPKAWPERIGLS